MQASVKLLPEDKIEIVSDEAEAGHVILKPLRDCTLADLARYADSLEESVTQEDLDAVRLLDVANHSDATVKIEIINDKESSLPSAETIFYGSAVVIEQALIDELDMANVGSDEALEEIEDALEDGLEEAAAALASSVPPLDPLSLMDAIVVSDTEPVYGESTHVEGETPNQALPDLSDQRMAGIILPPSQPSPSATDILMVESAFDDAKSHALSSLSREVAGFLIGPPPEKQSNGRYIVRVTQAIRAGHTRMQGASVTYTPESWREINDWLHAFYPNEEQVIVGWYHTHPGFGIFLSNMDLFIHHNFFSQKWHIAYVLDPIAKRSGFFTWDSEQENVLAYPFPWPYWAHSSW